MYMLYIYTLYIYTIYTICIYTMYRADIWISWAKGFALALKHSIRAEPGGRVRYVNVGEHNPIEQHCYNMLFAYHKLYSEIEVINQLNANFHFFAPPCRSQNKWTEHPKKTRAAWGKKRLWKITKNHVMCHYQVLSAAYLHVIPKKRTS